MPITNYKTPIQYKIEPGSRFNVSILFYLLPHPLLQQLPLSLLLNKNKIINTISIIQSQEPLLLSLP